LDPAEVTSIVCGGSFDFPEDVGLEIGVDVHIVGRLIFGIHFVLREIVDTLLDGDDLAFDQESQKILNRKLHFSSMCLHLILVDFDLSEIGLHFADFLEDVFVFGIADCGEDGVVHDLYQYTMFSEEFTFFKSQDHYSWMLQGLYLGLNEVLDDFLHHDELFEHHSIERGFEFVGLGSDQSQHSIDVMQGVLSVGPHLIGRKLMPSEVLLEVLLMLP
jgi:hypothetical protein